MVNYLALHLLCPGKCSAGNSSFVHHTEQQQNSPLSHHGLPGSILHILVFGSVSGHHHSSHPLPPLLDISCCRLSLTWTCWESFLLLLRGDKPISKAGACRVADLHHSSASESIGWADAWSPRGSPVMVITSASVCYDCQSYHFLVFDSQIAAHRAF